MTYREALLHLDDTTVIRRKGWKKFVFKRPAERTTAATASCFNSLPTIVRFSVAGLPAEREVLMGETICLFTNEANIINGYEPNADDKFANDWKAIRLHEIKDQKLWMQRFI